MDYIILLGLLAGTLTTIAMLPQLLKIYRTKSVKDISLLMFAISSTGIFLWVIYGFLIHSMPVIIANICSFILAFSIMVMKIKYRKHTANL